MDHVGVCGGSKVIFEHINGLQKRGVETFIVCHFNKPTWFELDTTYIKVPYGIDLSRGIPHCDLIVATYYVHIQSCIDVGIAPVVYFEQGDKHLVETELVEGYQKEFVHKMFEIAPFITTVSMQASKAIKQVFGRDSEVFFNSINPDVFNQDNDVFSYHNPYILIMGHPDVPFKNLPLAMDAFDLVRKKYPTMELFWISPSLPTKNALKRVNKIFISPSQEEISSLYRGASLYISASTIESFSLPCLEAMSCGCPVVSASNQGVLEYGMDGENLLLARPNDALDLANKALQLLSDETLKNSVVESGLQTAKHFSWNGSIDSLLDYYKNVATNAVDSTGSVDDFDCFVSREHFSSEDDFKCWQLFLSNNTADLIYLPAVFKIGDWFENGSWCLAAKRRFGTGKKIDKLYVKVEPFATLNDEIMPGILLLKQGQFEDAFMLFAPKISFSREYVRFTVISLLLLVKYDKALSLISTHMQKLDDSDLIYLLLYTLDKLNIPLEGSEEYKYLVHSKGESVDYDHFICDIEKHIDDLLQ
jgi:glycosyltransferase involved in cell wall biosynthesis